MSQLGYWLLATIAAAISLSPGLAQAGLSGLTPGSVIIIQATQPGGNAADCADAECANGPVAKALVDALGKTGITVAGLFDHVNASVAGATKGSQIPWLSASAPVNVPLYDSSSRAFALAIGNGEYKHLLKLKGAPRDGDAVGKSLKGAGFQTTTLIDADGEALAKAIDAFVQNLGDGDIAVLYYSGHGFSVNGEGYIPPLSGALTDERALVQSSIAVATLVDKISHAKAKQKVLILDTHYPSLRSGGAR